jgi:hypothetical protein
VRGAGILTMMYLQHRAWHCCAQIAACFDKETVGMTGNTIGPFIGGAFYHKRALNQTMKIGRLEHQRATEAQRFEGERRQYQKPFPSMPPCPGASAAWFICPKVMWSDSAQSHIVFDRVSC